MPPRSSGQQPAVPVVGRRGFLGLLGAGAAGAAVGFGTGRATAGAEPEGQAGTVQPGRVVHPFYGTHQSGIATPAQARAQFLSLDLPSGSGRPGAAAVADLMRDWTVLAAALTSGSAAADDPMPVLAQEPAALTVTFGFGPTLFDKLDLVDRRPPGVVPFPAFSHDRLEPRWSGGDLLIQVCADDSLVVSHAARALLQAAGDRASLRWRQVGFVRHAGVAPGQTGRNLMGSKDGTANDPPGSDRFAQTVWAQAVDPAAAWFAGGTTMVVRRISMDLAAWESAALRTQERVIGRHLDTGAPLGSADEFDPVPLTAQDARGRLVIPSSAHVRLAHPDSNNGARIVRRGYNYDDGDDAGLIFVALQADATKGFLPVQSRIAAGDDLNRFTTAIGTATFAIPPGAVEGGFVGSGLLA